MAGRGAATTPERLSVQRVRGWLAAGHTAVGLLWTGQENMESQRKRHYDIKQSMWMHLCVV